MREYSPAAPTGRSPVDDPLASSRVQFTESGAVADAALTARLACDDAAALDPLYRRHKGLVYRFALLWSGSPSVAADVTQDVFLHLLQHAGDYDPTRGPLSPWLLGIARNFVRHRTATPFEIPIGDDFASFPATIDARTPDTMLIEREDLERLRRGIAALPPHYRDVLVLVDLAERSYVEAAAICGCELNTVRSRLHRGRVRLAAWLALDARLDRNPAAAIR